MPVIIRTATIVESPDPSQGSASALPGAVATGHGSASASASSGGGGPTQTVRRTCRWRNFGPPVGGIIVQIRLVYSWSWSWSATASLVDEGSCSSSISYFFGQDVGASGGAGPLSGPGGGFDSNSDSLDGSSSIILPNNTDLSLLQVQTELFATAESGISGSSGSADAQISAAISGLQVEIITDPGGAPIVFM